MNRYRLLDGTVSRQGVTYRKGAELTLTSDQVERLGLADRILLIGESEMSENTTNTAKPTYTPTTIEAVTATDWSKTQDMKAPEVVALVNESDSKAELQALYETESKGQNRIGVLNAIKKRATQLEAD